MAKSQENGTAILLGLKGYEVGAVKEDSKGVTVEVRVSGEGACCPGCGTKTLYRHGACLSRRVLHS